MSCANSPSFIVILVSLCWSFARVECIIGGNSTKSNEFKYVVYIEQMETGGYFTGGILNENFILTFARGVIQEDNTFISGRIKVIAGTNDVENKSNPGIERLVKEIIVPEIFSGSDPLAYSDFALLRLTEPLDLSDRRLESLRLPTKSEGDNYIKHKPLKFAGFGRTDRIDYGDGTYGHEKEFDGKLRKADVKFSENCDGAWIDSIPQSAFCAKMVNNQHLKQIGLCNGDNGGPLIRGRRTVVGVASFMGLTCNENEQPSVFTRVNQYAAAIQDVMDGRSLDGRRKVANETGYF